MLKDIFWLFLVFIVIEMSCNQIPVHVRVPDNIEKFLYKEQKEVYGRQEIEDGIYRVLQELAVNLYFVHFIKHELASR